jgi:hypothetical protein
MLCCSRCRIEATWDEGVKAAAAHVRSYILSPSVPTQSSPIHFRPLPLQVSHSVSVICEAVDQGMLTPVDATARLHALAEDVAFTSLPPSHAARADVMAAVSKLAAVAEVGAVAKAAAASALAATYRIQVGGGLHVKPLALLLTGISIQALGAVDAGREEGRLVRLKELQEELERVFEDVMRLQGKEGALVLISKKLQAQVNCLCK